MILLVSFIFTDTYNFLSKCRFFQNPTKFMLNHSKHVSPVFIGFSAGVEDPESSKSVKNAKI